MNRDGWAAGLVVLTFALGSAPALAQWGSIRANNRSDREHEHEHTENRRVEPQPVVRPGVEVDRGRHAEIETGRGREVQVVPRVREPEHIDRRYHDVDIDRHRGYFWSNYHPGLVVRGLPTGYRTVLFGGVPYYYYEGVYYQPSGTGYAVVNPPVGVIVPGLPPGAEALLVNGLTYYYAGGTFYVAQPGGFAVVPPPLGVTVTALPAGAAPVMINGVLYYTANSVYYLPVIQNGVTVYTVVQP